MTEEKNPDVSAAADLSRRQWLLRLGEMVVLAGVSGLVPDSAAALLSAAQEPDTALTTLPPGLYDPSPDHLVHALSSGGGQWSPPPGSETDYVQSGSLPHRPVFFSEEEFQVLSRFVEIILGSVDSSALSQAAEWLDRWLYASAGVRAAARHLDPLHRILAVAVNGEESVRELETFDPQPAARAGLAALRDLAIQNYGHNFLQLTAAQQIELVTSIAGTSANENSGAAGAASESPLHKFFAIARGQAIRGYYTSAAGLKELNYKGNAYYPESPGCAGKS